MGWLQSMILQMNPRTVLSIIGLVLALIGAVTAFVNARSDDLASRGGIAFTDPEDTGKVAARRTWRVRLGVVVAAVGALLQFASSVYPRGE
jgi:hypothetical protein